ncbi:hypothetical protein EBR43_10450 [bacterium]|nr:hypothetical protein [bacterium]
MKGYDPAEQLTTFEQNHLFLSFCSFVSLNNTKKLNLANVFIVLLKEPLVRELFKVYCDYKNDLTAIKFFLQFDSSLHKSKYIMKFLNSKKSGAYFETR